MECISLWFTLVGNPLKWEQELGCEQRTNEQEKDPSVGRVIYNFFSVLLPSSFCCLMVSFVFSCFIVLAVFFNFSYVINIFVVLPFKLTSKLKSQLYKHWVVLSAINKYNSKIHIFRLVVAFTYSIHYSHWFVIKY